MHRSIFLAAGLMMIISPAINARIINVPNDFETIQTAIDDASANQVDTVLVENGVYRGAGNTNLSISRELVLMSANGALETTIDCEGAADSRTIFSTTSVTIAGFTITGATTNGIRVDNAQRLLIDGCRFVENNGNVAQQSGGGFQLRTCVGRITNCIFEGNSNIGSGGGGIMNTSRLTIEGCVFRSNHADRFGGALHITTNNTVTILNCLFTQNTAGIDGGAIGHSAVATTDISFCTFIENEATGLGGAIYKGSNSNPTITDCIFWGNRATRGNQLAEQIPPNGGEIIINFCIVEGGADEGDENGEGAWGGENIIDEEPMLTDGREPVWGMNGFFLNQEESPAVDAGSAGAEELGVDILTTNPDLTTDADQADLGFHYWIGWYNIFGRVYGRVLDLADDSPIEGVRVTTTLNQSAITDDEGNWEIPEARVGVFDITATKAYYFPVTLNDQEVEEDGELEVTHRLPHPEFRLSVEEFASEIGVEDTTDVIFEVFNDGNGPVSWSAYAKLRDEDNQDPWESINTFPVGNDVQDNRITGVAFDGEHYYVSGADADEPSKIYVLDTEGRQTGEFVQAGSARFGMRDLAWDGELLWGASNQDIIGFTTDGDSITSFQGPFNPTYAVTYDSDNELFWLSAITTDIFGYDRAGNQVARLNRGSIRIYGLAHWSDDPDGATLYIHGNTAAEAAPQVFKINPDNGETTTVDTLATPANSNAEGAEIFDGIDSYATSMITVYNHADGDYIGIWRINKRDGWALFEPAEGIVEGGESMEVTMTLTSNEFVEGLYHAEAHFAFSALGDSITIPIEMQVVAGAVHAVRAIPLPMGWSLISSHLQPDDADIRTIMQPLVDAGRLMFMKDTEGRIYIPRPQNPFINMQPWDVERPYWIKLNSPGILRLEGVTVLPDRPLNLNQGWNGVAYLPRVIMDPRRAFEGIIDDVELVRDGEGRFLLPRYNFSNLQPCRQGNGYLVKVSRDVEFVWGGAPQNDFALPPQRLEKLPERFEVPSPTGFTMSVLMLAASQDGDEIAILSRDRIVGGGVVSGGMCGFAVPGDDPLTPEIEGAVEGEALEVVRYRLDVAEVVSPKLIEGGLTYTRGGLTVAELSGASLPESAMLIGAFPNPFNSTTAVNVSIPAAGEVRIGLFDTEGRLILKVYQGSVPAGQHRFAIDGGQLSSGLYFLKLDNGTRQATTRLLLIR